MTDQRRRCALRSERLTASPMSAIQFKSRRKGAVFGMPLYGWKGMKVFYWDVHYVEVESINIVPTESSARHTRSRGGITQAARFSINHASRANGSASIGCGLREYSPCLPFHTTLPLSLLPSLILWWSSLLSWWPFEVKRIRPSTYPPFETIRGASSSTQRHGRPSCLPWGCGEAFRRLCRCCSVPRSFRACRLIQPHD